MSEICALQTLCSAHATSAYPPVLPCEIEMLTPRESKQILRVQRDRIFGTYASDFIVKIDDEVKEFEVHMSHFAAA